MQFLRGLMKRLPALVFLGLIIIVLWQHQALIDWIKLRGYQPPADIVKLADDDTMTPNARHIYYINHPKLISSSQEFSRDCPVVEQTIVLGCYQSGESGIYLRNVTDARLNGVEEVTAAHEMLHGAYERLGAKDKDYINGLLMDFYNTGLDDQRIKNTIDAYRKSEPNDLINEMHSIFGSEVASLPSPLENYYQRYFANRSAITSFASVYEAEFTGRISQIKAYETQLNVLKQTIDALESRLGSESSQLQTDRSSLDSLRSSGQIAQYNARVPAFNQEVENYNSGVNELKADINSYNFIVRQHNQLADELRGLYTSLGTSLSTQTSQ